MLYHLILFLLFFLLILILLSLIFYYRVKAREYYFTSTTTGSALTYDASGDFHKLRVDGNLLEFLPFYEDRKRKVRGKLVLTTYSTNTESQFFKIKVMNGSEKLSEGTYEIKPRMDYNYINFKVDGKDNRRLTIDIQKYNRTTQQSDTTTPTGLNLVKAYGYYYY